MYSIREKVVDHYKTMCVEMPQYLPTSMAELAPGVVAVEDESGECDAFFDTNEWKYSNPIVWEDAKKSEGYLFLTYGMKVLEGLGTVPKISSIIQMMGFAKTHISPTGVQTWHKEPIFFD